MLDDKYVYAVNCPSWGEIFKKLGLTIPPIRNDFTLNRYMKCFLHKEKTASLSLVERKSFWYCFGCHEGGDKFHFVSVFLFQRNYKRTARWFEKKFGIPSPYRGKSKPRREV